MIELEFLITSLIVILIPGTGAIYTISLGISQSWQNSIFAALGCTLGIIPHMAITIFGLSAIMHMSAQLFQMIKFGGAIYLLYLAWLMWHETGTIELNNATGSTKPLNIILKGVLINLLNPKLTIFFFAFLPLFISPTDGSKSQEMLYLGVIFMVLTFIVFVGYGLLSSKIRGAFTTSSKAIKRLQRSFSLIFVLLAAELVLAEQ